VAALLNFATVQLERTRVGHVLCGVRGSLLGKALSQIWPIGPGQKASHPGVVRWLAGDIELCTRCCVLAGIGDELFDFGVGSPRVREDADLHPDRGGPAVLSNLLIEPPPGCRIGVGPGLDHHAAVTVWAPHTLPFDGNISLSDVLSHRAADEAHRVGRIVRRVGFDGGTASPCRGHGMGGREEVEEAEKHYSRGVCCANRLSRRIRKKLLKHCCSRTWKSIYMVLFSSYDSQKWSFSDPVMYSPVYIGNLLHYLNCILVKYDDIYRQGDSAVKH
jgi:hypothetical protein